MISESIIEWWDNSQTEAWRDYILSKWRGLGRVEELSGDDQTLNEIRLRARQAFEAHDIPVKRLRVWANVQIHEKGSGWAEGYPHRHNRGDAVTLVHYLDPGDKPAPLHVIHAESTEVIYPEAGKTVYMPNSSLHGVLRNNGTTPRVAFIATAYPK